MAAGFWSGPKCIQYQIMWQLCSFHWKTATAKHSPTAHYWKKWAPQKSEEKPPNSICTIVGRCCCYFHYRKCFPKIAMLPVLPVLWSLTASINKSVTKLYQKVPALTLFTLEGRYNDLGRSFESYYGKPWLQWQTDDIEKPTHPHCVINNVPEGCSVIF